MRQVTVVRGRLTPFRKGRVAGDREREAYIRGLLAGSRVGRLRAHVEEGVWRWLGR